MNEELGVKVTVTRLRRRLSVESEDANSPSAPSTPTKKRSARLAAKPQLELIDEDVPENVPKRTRRKSVARDAVEPVEEKALTPARRSARIRSNNSLLAETTLPTDSPRAKRAAARRNSQLDSDAETPLTPAKATRRTRKNSTTAVEPAKVNSDENVVVFLVTTEESKTNSNDTGTNDKMTPTKENSQSQYSYNNEDFEKVATPTTPKRHSISEHTQDTLQSTDLKANVDNNEKEANDINENKNLSMSSTKLINNMDLNKKISAPLNKSIPMIENTQKKTKKQRTKSWCSESPIKCNTSDKASNLMNNSHNKSSTKSPKQSIKIESISDNKENEDISITDDILDINSTEKQLEKTPTKNVNVVLIEDSDSNTGSIDKLIGFQDNCEDQCVPVVESQSLVNSNSKIDNDVEPMDIDETIPENVTIEDFSDKANSSKEEAQVPDTKRKSSINKDTSLNLDESVNKSKRTSSISSTDSKRKISITVDETNNAQVNRKSLNSSFNNNSSKRKSSINPDEAVNSQLNSSKQASFNSSQSESNTKRKSSSNIEETSNPSLNTSKQTSFDSSLIDNKKNRKKSMSIDEADSSLINTSKQTFLNSSQTNKENKRKSSININEPSESLVGICNDDVKTIKDKSSFSLRKSSVTEKVSKEDSKQFNEDTNRSTRKSLIESQSLEKSSNENKSTLVLSQIKDVSTNDTKNDSRSPNNSKNDLSKCQDAPKDNNKKNVTQNYLTSTPLQQKSLQKLAMQINTSVISPNINNKSLDNQRSKTQSQTSALDTSESSDDESNENLKDKSKIIDEEASEASEDYESGDSRDDNEREYEEQNEIVEKGETLESEDEFSDDSDYEKDSFVVSSAEEDEDKLSGTGDDLSLSDNELTMSSKSKKKYDDRKRKEQKKASREMYESRHKLNESGKSSNKSKSKRLESSDSDSDHETEIPKNKSRLRIDSSHDVSSMMASDNDSIRKNKKKTRRLSDSMSEENEVLNEKEITGINESIMRTNDPLSSAVKQEPKTPQKYFNITTVPIVDNIEEVELDANVSILKSNETTDPLQATLVEEEDSSSSDNMEIMNNYDSVLENLNKENKKKPIKTMDISLNLNKKKETKAKDCIVDQLNLTQGKKEKKIKQKPIEQNKTNEPEIIKDNDYEDNSDSIDMRLLFPEDSNDSVVSAYNTKSKQEAQPAEEFIPLRRSEAKTHIPDTTDTTLTESSLNISKKKNKKRFSKECSDMYDNNDDDIKIFIDTTGTHDIDTSNVSLTSSSKKKKNKNKNKSLINESCEGFNQNDGVDAINASRDINNETQVDEVTEVQANLSLKSDKKKKKNKDVSLVGSIEDVNESRIETCIAEKSQTENTDNGELNISKDKSGMNVSTQSATNSSKKKKNKKNKNRSINNESTNEVNQTLCDDSNKATVDIEEIVQENENDISLTSEKKKKKKNKNKNQSVNDVEEENIVQNLINDSAVTQSNIETIGTEIQKEQTSISNTSNFETSFNKKDKKKKSNTIEVPQSLEDEGNNSDDAPIEVSYKDIKPEENMGDEATTVSAEKKKHKKNKKKKKNKTAPTDENSMPIQQTNALKKRKLDDEAELENNVKNDAQVPIANGIINQKKKRKISNNNTDENALPDIGTKVSKKRKLRDEDMEQKQTKKSKNNSFEKIHVQRLPSSILEKLDDKPQVEQVPKKKLKAIATSEFEVQEAKRRNKPSNFLEESVYLNDTPVKQKQKKPKQKIPKVLPFVPTAIASDKGYTSKFRINVLPNETEFVAQATNIVNFKTDLLSNRRIKKMGTLERCKQQITTKLSKF